MASNRLRLNPAKTNVIWLGTSRRVQQCTTDPLQLHGASIQPSNCVRDLGVVVDSGLTLVDHVAHITSVCFFHIRQLWVIRRSLTVDTAHSLVQALVNRQLDYCNALFATLPAGHMSRLQSVLRAAPRFVMQLPGQAPVSSHMCNSLHWLNFPQRVTYKLCLLTYKCLHGLAPDHLTRLCVGVATVVLGCDQLLIPRTRTVTLGHAPSIPPDQYPGTLYTCCAS